MFNKAQGFPLSEIKQMLYFDDDNELVKFLSLIGYDDFYPSDLENQFLKYNTRELLKDEFKDYLIKEVIFFIILL
jgi:hypothetical protein